MSTTLRELKKQIAQGARLPHQAAAMGMQLFLLLASENEDREAVRAIARDFVERLAAWGLDNLLEGQCEYATRLAASSGDLEYEEMHKLFSLCDQVHALRELGLRSRKQHDEALDSALRKRFADEPRKARLVAEDRAEEWNRRLWWYATNLG